MESEMALQVVPLSEQLLILAALKAAAAPLDGAKLHLYSNNIAPTPGMVIGALTECTFLGSVAQSVVWGTPHIDPQGNAVMDAGSLTFVAGSPIGASETVYGAYITDTAGAVLLAACKFDAPISMNAPGQGLVVVIEYGQGGGWIVL
jgi:hypothetical protein